MTMLAIDSKEFRRVLGHFPTGVVVVTAVGSDGTPAGMAIGSFTSVSLEPPLVAFLPAKTSSSWPRMSTSGAFCVNVLGESQGDLGKRFATSGGDKFAGIDWTPAPSGSPILPSVLAWIDCDVVRVDDAGDHLLVMGQVRALSANPEGGGPLVFYRGSFGQFAPAEGDQ